MATATKRGDTYRIRVSLGYDINGKQIVKSTTWKPDGKMTPKQEEKELERRKLLFEEKCLSGQVLDGSIKFADFADKWFKEYAEKQLRAKTLARYKDLMKRINPAIGHIKLDKLQPHHLLSFYDNLEETGIREDVKYRCIVDFKALLKERTLTKVNLSQAAGVSIAVLNSITQGKNITLKSATQVSKVLELDMPALFKPVNSDSTLSAKTIHHHHLLISSILSTAVQWQVIFSNPCERVKPPKVERKEARYMDEYQTAELLERLEYEDIQYKTIIKLFLYTGFRRGELCGLEWQDIDFDNQVIHVRRASLYLPENGIFEDETKNYTSKRSIKVSASVIDMLREYKTWQIKQRLMLGDQWVVSDRLFTAWNGKPIHPDTISNWFRNFITKNNLPEVSIHSLRHTNATLLIASGTPLKTVSSRLGHANQTTTGNIYAHAIRSADEAAAETLQDILNPVRKSDIG